MYTSRIYASNLAYVWPIFEKYIINHFSLNIVFLISSKFMHLQFRYAVHKVTIYNQFCFTLLLQLLCVSGPGAVYRGLQSCLGLQRQNWENERTIIFNGQKVLLLQNCTYKNNICTTVMDTHFWELLKYIYIYTCYSYYK